MRTKQPSRGFTLIELLVVIAVVGVLAGALIVLINPAAMLDRARIAKGKNFQGQLTTGPLGFYNVGAWNFNESTNPAADTSGNNNTATINGATYVPNCDLGFGGCFSFDALDDNVTISSATSLDFTASGQYTIGFWMKPNSIPTGTNGTSLFSKSNSGNGIAVYMANNGYVIPIYPGSSNCGNTNCNNSSGMAVPTTSWSHIVVTYNNGESKVYLNGDLKNTLQVSGAINNTGNDITLSLGNGACSGFQSCAYPGNLDEVYIFNKALSQAMIKRYYAVGTKRHSLASLQ